MHGLDPGIQNSVDDGIDMHVVTVVRYSVTR